MPRPKKCRRVCGVPPCAAFGPKDGAAPCESVPLALDEYETIRLIDLEGLQQEQAAQAMGVGRATVQAIYTSARRKLADCVVHGKLLDIGGGDVELCPGREHCRRSCRHQQCPWKGGQKTQ